MAVENEQKLENIRIAMEKKIGQLNEDNQKAKRRNAPDR